MPGKHQRKLSHDKIFKTLLKNFFRDWIELPERDIASELDPSTVEYLGGESFAELRRDGHLLPDFVARLERRISRLPVVIHVETEGRYRSTISSRMWNYFTHLASLNRDAQVLPIVVFLRGGPPDLREYEFEGAIGSFVPTVFRYLALGLSGCLAEEWLRKPQPLVAALAAFMRSKTWDRVEHKLQCMRRALAETDPARRYLLTKVIDTSLNLKEAERSRYEATLARENTMMMPDALTLEEALQESEERGRALATAEAIVLLAESRFGTVSAELREKLAKISNLKRLRKIFGRAIEAPSLDQLEAALR